jgi:hypothetical protein
VLSVVVADVSVKSVFVNAFVRKRADVLGLSVD